MDDDGDEIENMARIPLPSAVKTRLVQEWDMVTRDGMHVPLPKSVTVDKLLDDFLKSVEGQGSFWGEVSTLRIPGQRRARPHCVVSAGPHTPLTSFPSFPSPRVAPRCSFSIACLRACVRACVRAPDHERPQGVL